MANAVKKGVESCRGMSGEVNVAESCEVVAHRAASAADYVKFVPGGIGSVFQLAALIARLAMMFAEAKRGSEVLPGIIAQRR